MSYARGIIQGQKGKGIMESKFGYAVGCRICNCESALLIFPSDLESWYNGTLIQKAMPYLDADERALLISGTCGKCWDEMFGTDLDDDES